MDEAIVLILGTYLQLVTNRRSGGGGRFELVHMRASDVVLASVQRTACKLDFGRCDKEQVMR